MKKIFFIKISIGLFGFMVKIISKTFRGANSLIETIVWSRPYKLDWKHVFEELQYYDHTEIEDFAASYTYDHAEEHGLMDDKKIKRAIYTDICDKMAQWKEQGKLA